MPSDPPPALSSASASVFFRCALLAAALLSLTELNRNTFTGAVSRFALNAMAVPDVDAVLSKPTRSLKGNLAIEGRLRNPTTGEILHQFSGSAESRSAFLLPVTDFTPYGQARQALRSWATQFEALTRTAPGQRVRGHGRDQSVLTG